ncbi:MAG: segregation/condensation protein A [Acidobacteria bacterium]|nr:segregation/condensation protein A [Acidobacteriota bacterium]
MDSLPSVQLEVYEGPLDLLLDLIRKQQLNIFDIPIARITQQYLDYLHRLEQLNIDIAGDFILMAATLIQIKSKMLLPPDPLAGPGQAEDPRTDLVARLLEHEKFKSAAQMLQQKQVLEQATWSRPDLGAFADEQGELVVTLWDLVKAFREVLERPPGPAALEIVREEITVAEMMEEVRRALRESQGSVPLLDLCRRYPHRRGLIALFLALLELVRLEAVIAVQAELFGPIFLRKHKLFDVVFSDDTAAQIDQQYN